MSFIINVQFYFYFSSSLTLMIAIEAAQILARILNLRYGIYARTD